LGLVVGHVTSVSAARRFTLALLLAFVGTAARADTWNDLWATREQQAQQLLESKKAAEAAPLFSDPRRRAYAELEAGQYAKAAEHLAPFKDADSQYNRGNALAHTGKLQDALAAYDAALAQSPGNGDVKRNRDLVAQALKQQSQQGQQQGGGNSQSDKQGKGQPGGGQSSPGANGQGDKGQDASNQGSQGQQANRDQPGNPTRTGSQATSPRRRASRSLKSRLRPRINNKPEARASRPPIRPRRAIVRNNQARLPPKATGPPMTSGTSRLISRKVHSPTALAPRRPNRRHRRKRPRRRSPHSHRHQHRRRRPHRSRRPQRPRPWPKPASAASPAPTPFPPKEHSPARTPLPSYPVRSRPWPWTNGCAASPKTRVSCCAVNS